MTYDPFGAGPQDTPPPHDIPSPYGDHASPYGDQGGYGPYMGPTGMYGPMKPPGTVAAMWAHLGALLCGAGGGCLYPFAWLPALIIRKSAQNQGNPLIRHHTTQALNITLTGLILATITLATTVACGVAGLLGSDGSDGRASTDPSIGVVVLVAGLFVTLTVHGIASFVYMIIASVKASSGQYFRYPRYWVALPLISD